jgi:hypothetical protein
LGSVPARIPIVIDLDGDPTDLISDGDWGEVDSDHGTVEIIKKGLQ